MSQAVPERRRYPAMALLKWLSYEALLGSAVSSGAAHCLAVIAATTRPTGLARITVPALARAMATSERTVQRALGELLAHVRAPLRRYTGSHHDSSEYEVTATAYAAWERRGVYARFSDEGADEDAAAQKEAAAAADPAAGGSSSGVTPVSPLGPGGVTAVSPLAASGVTPVSPLGPGGVTNLTRRGDTRVTHMREQIETTQRTAAAAVPARAQQQQPVDQRPEDRAAAESLIAEIVAAREQRVALRDALAAEGVQPAAGDLSLELRGLTPAMVLATATAFRPDGNRVVQHTRLDRLSGPWLERSLIELRRMAAVETAAARDDAAAAAQQREMATRAAEWERERAEDDDPTLPDVTDHHRDGARRAWELVRVREGAAAPGPRHVVRWLALACEHHLTPVALVGNVLLVLAARRNLGLGAEALALLDERAQAAGLTCRVAVGTYGELRVWLNNRSSWEAVG